MDFLSYIDKYHEDQRQYYEIEETNESFNSFISIAPIGIELSKKYIIQKNEKSKLLLIDGKQRVYLSDIDVICTIINLNPNVRNWIISKLIDFYRNTFEVFKFSINGLEFESVGIGFYQDNNQIALFSDTLISINDFLFILNFILSKDYQWGININNHEFYYTTLIKYITLIDFYSNDSERSKQFLNSIHYPINHQSINEVRNHDQYFKKENILMFDISVYN